MKIGLITYHSAYNFGSGLQALATQNTLEKLGFQVDVINYRMRNQKDYYQKLYRTNYGIKTFVKDSLMFPVSEGRKKRAEAFEKFIGTYFHLTAEMEDPEDVIASFDDYPTVVSGSDQIWNYHSNELRDQPRIFASPYLLRGYKGKKVSYASSIGNMTDSELNEIVDDIRSFDYVSLREKSSCGKLKEMYGIEAVNVPDPTFLLGKGEWIRLLGLKPHDEQDYILYYSLGGIKDQIARMKQLGKMAKKMDCKVKIVTPFSYIPVRGDVFEHYAEYGPIEFLEALMSAKMVITDSYHGTILSINFGKDFYSICKSGGSHFRKVDALEALGIPERCISSLSEIPHSAIDYSAVSKNVEAFRALGIEYLKKALQ